MAVNTLRQQGKIKTLPRPSGQRSDFKKAIVTLAEGQIHRRDDGSLRQWR